MKNAITLTIFKCDTPNKNNRIYPYYLMKKELSKAYIRDCTDNNCLLCYIKNEEQDYSISNVVGYISKFTFSDKNKTIKATIKFLNTPMGESVKNLVNKGRKIYLYPNGIGEVEQSIKGYERITSYELLNFLMEVL